jgi:hypothetical protein
MDKRKASEYGMSVKQQVTQKAIADVLLAALIYSFDFEDLLVAYASRIHLEKP